MELVKRFAAAGLELELTERPIRNVRNVDVFQMDVAIRGRRKGSPGREVFQIWQGHKYNRLQLVGLDRDEEQLVLMVHEPSRTLVRRERNHNGRFVKTEAHFKASFPQAMLVLLSANAVLFEERAPDKKRHYLCGEDERQLFIAELPVGLSTVREA